ncbi:hypothetical protein SAMN04487907_101255 [Zunongwangia mangrovi]|uniref:Uncharacterized protein n=1 Tax=Zunongwangia mangrovi TaxID=1334022 RepID=A0A1I1DHX9_9FLAO|nr:hypothetical protein [Zunongwangia mangrovi]SFB72123.1 hypothetical protein SAMN04487907_101255 [Zunongwangia mangrovi]
MDSLDMIISISASIFSSSITYYLAVRKSRNDKLNLEREISARYGEKLNELRLKYYGRAFELTDLLGKRIRDEDDLPGIYKTLINGLRDWKTGEVNLILSDNSLNCFYELIEASKAELALGTKYNDQQLDKIWLKRTGFRNSLRQDLGILRLIDSNQKINFVR